MPRPGRPSIPDAASTSSPTSSDIGWAAGIFQTAGFFDREVTDVSNRVPTAFVLLLRLPRSEIEYDILERFLSFFGGRIRSTTSPGRFEWICRAERAHGVLLTLFSFFSRSVRSDARLSLQRDGQLVVRIPATAGTSSPVRRDLPVPKHHMALHPDYDDIVFLNVEDVPPGESYVFRLPDVPTLERFSSDALRRGYIILQTVELTVSLTRPHDFA